jgi:hypothetical protein
MTSSVDIRGTLVARCERLGIARRRAEEKRADTLHRLRAPTK